MVDLSIVSLNYQRVIIFNPKSTTNYRPWLGPTQCHSPPNGLIHKKHRFDGNNVVSINGLVYGTIWQTTLLTYGKKPWFPVKMFPLNNPLITLKICIEKSTHRPLVIKHGLLKNHAQIIFQLNLHRRSIYIHIQFIIYTHYNPHCS